MITTHDATQALATTIAAAWEAATGSADGLLITLDPTAASAAVTSGTPAMIVPPPTITNAHPAVTLEWELPLIGAPIADEQAAWEVLDRILTVLDDADVSEWTTARPITWGGSQTAQAPAYLLTATTTLGK